MYLSYVFRIQQLLRYRNIKGNVTETGQAVEIEDKFDMLVDANDQILETVVSQAHRKPHCVATLSAIVGRDVMDMKFYRFD